MLRKEYNVENKKNSNLINLNLNSNKKKGLVLDWHYIDNLHRYKKGVDNSWFLVWIRFHNSQTSLKTSFY